MGSKITCSSTFVVPASGTLAITTSALSSTEDPLPGNNDNTKSVLITPQADMRALTTLPVGPVLAGQPVTVTGTCTNFGPSDAVAPTCVLTGLPAGSSQSCTPNPVPGVLALNQAITCTSTFTAPASGPLNITTTANADTADFIPDKVNNVDTKALAITPQADMRAVLSGFPDTAPANGTVTGTLTCTNLGPSVASPATCAVTAGLPLGAVVNCVPSAMVGNLASGASIVCSVSFTIPPEGVSLVATAGSGTGDPSPLNNTMRKNIFAFVNPTSVPVGNWWLVFALLAVTGVGAVRRRRF
jgi:large repetitive protein